MPQEITLNALPHGDPDTLDPTLATDGLIPHLVFEPLLRFDQHLVPQPAAAQSYEVSADGTLYTFHLRDDGRWSDGQPVTASQFEYAWKRLLDARVHAAAAPLFADAGIASVSALDDLTLQIRLNQPFGALPDLAALWEGVPLRPDVVAANPGGWAADPASYIGNGPFMVSEWTHQDHLTLVANPSYVAHLGWPRPTLTRITFPLTTNPDADWSLVPDTDVNRVLNDPSLASQSREYTDLTTFWLQMNNAHAPLDNVLVRRALSKALDRGALVSDLASGVGVQATSMLPPGMPGFQGGLGSELGFDPGGARALLAQSGFDGSPLTLVLPDTLDDRRRAEVLQTQLDVNAGVTVQLDPLDVDAYQQALGSGSYDLAFGGWTGDYPDPRDWFELVFNCKAAFNVSRYCDPALDQLVARAGASVGLTDQLALYAQAQTLLVRDVPVAPLFVRAHLVLVKPWVRSIDGSPLPLTPVDQYPGTEFLDEVQILPH